MENELYSSEIKKTKNYSRLRTKTVDVVVSRLMTEIDNRDRLSYVLVVEIKCSVFKRW